MRRIQDTQCRKCGGYTSIQWIEGEQSTGMDIHRLQPPGMQQKYMRCGFREMIADLEDEENNKTNE